MLSLSLPGGIHDVDDNVNNDADDIDAVNDDGIVAVNDDGINAVNDVETVIDYDSMRLFST